MKNSELCVPAATLTETTEAPGETVAPEMGDEVEVTIRGRVTRSEGGNVYLQPTAANGQPLPDSGNEGDAPEEDLEAEGRELERMSASGGGGYGLLVALVLALLGLEAGAADLEFAKDRYCIQTVSNNVAYTVPRQVFSVEVGHYVGSTLYLMVFDSATNQLANAIPHFTPIPVTNAVVVGKDWGAAGVPFRYGVNVCLSTTPITLTNASGGGCITVISSPPKP